MSNAAFIAEIQKLRQATVQQLEELPQGHPDRASLQGRRDAFDEVFIFLGLFVGSRFPQVFCSACGECFGPGDNGFSHCENHAGLTPTGD